MKPGEHRDVEARSHRVDAATRSTSQTASSVSL
jgi:hypothetical protein